MKKKDVVDEVIDEVIDEAAEVMAENIAKVSAGMRALSESRLNARAVGILLYHSCGRALTIGQIEMILNRIENLDKTYLKQQKEK